MVSKYCDKYMSKTKHWVYKIVIVMSRICFKYWQGIKKGGRENIWNKIGHIYIFIMVKDRKKGDRGWLYYSFFFCGCLKLPIS